MADFGWITAGTLTTLEDGWRVDGSEAGSYGTPTAGGGAVSYDWSGVPIGASGSCGFCATDLDHGLALDVPDGSGELSFNVSLTAGLAESLGFSWGFGGFIVRMFLSYRGTSYLRINFVDYPFDGNASFRLWYPNGVNEPMRLDFTGGSVTMEPEPYFSPRAGLDWSSGNSSTQDPRAFPTFPFQPTPHRGTALVSAIRIRAWDPTAAPEDETPHFAVALAGEGWHETPPLIAGTLPDQPSMPAWLSTYTHVKL